MILTHRHRVKSLNGLLNKQARAVNFVWNFCNNTQKHALKWNKKWPSGYDLSNLTAGSCKELELHADTIQNVCQQYAQNRSQFRKPYLRYRGKKSLGWIPISAKALKEIPNGFRFMKHEFKIFKDRPLPPGAIIKNGSSFSQDSRGNWFINIVFEVPDVPLREIKTEVGIDLGLKDFAVLSTSEKIEAKKFYRKSEEKLAIAQRAKKKKQIKKYSF